MKERLYNTQGVRYNGILYCPYCGKELQKYDEVLDHYSISSYFNCNCEDANKEHEIDEKIAELQKQYPEYKYHLKSYSVLERK